MKKSEPLYTVAGNVIGAATVENSREVKKLKKELPHDPAIPLLGIYAPKHKNTHLKRYIHSNVHSSIIYNCKT